MKITKEFKAGLIVIVTFLAFWYMFQFLKGKELFSSENSYFIKFNEVSGLEKSKPVTIGGLKVGRVETIEPNFNTKKGISFNVKIIVNENLNLPENTIAEIFEPGLMSGKEIRLILGKSEKIIENGGSLKGKIQASLTDNLTQEIAPVKDNLNKILLNLDSTLSNANDVLNKENKRQLTDILENLNQTLISFKSTSNELNKLIIANNSKISGVIDNTNIVLKTTNSTIKKYEDVGEKINQLNLNSTFTKLDSNLENLNLIIEKLNKNEGSLGKLINDKQLYDNLTETTKSLDELLKDFKQSPKRYVHFSVFGKNEKKENVKNPQ